MNWITLIISGFLEVAGVSGIQRFTRGERVKGILLMIFGFISAILLLKIALLTIPLGIVYAVFAAMGTLGGAVMGMIFYGESKSTMRIVL